MIFHQSHPQRLSGNRFDFGFKKGDDFDKSSPFLPFNKCDCGV